MHYYTKKKLVLKGLIALAESQKQVWILRLAQCQTNLSSLDKIIKKRREELKKLEEKSN